MKSVGFKDFWKACWDDCNWLWRIILVITTPYLWICYGFAMAGYGDNKDE